MVRKQDQIYGCLLGAAAGDAVELVSGIKK